MGADLPPRPATASAATFIVMAMRDPGAKGRPGTPLQRIQIIKGWVAGDGTARGQVFEVAGDAGGGAKVDPASCKTSGTGASTLCAVWTDPQFSASDRAVYYARVLENPTCRWSTRLCNSLPPSKRPGGCSDARIPKVIQERAWSSPIWYRPPAKP